MGGKWQEGCPEHCMLDAAPGGVTLDCLGLGVALGHPEALPAQEVQGLGSGGH